MYHNYYVAQAGSGVSKVYIGSFKQQKGSGFGSLLSGFARFAAPFLMKGAKFFGRKALSTGSTILNDVVAGENFKTSAKRRIGETMQQIKDQHGNGLPRKKAKRVISTPPKSVKKRRSKPKHRDIFSP